MNNKKIIIIIIVSLVIVGFWTINKLIMKPVDSERVDHDKISDNFYWTCPMHPQIHMEHEGECPICHMKLVKVITSKKKQASSGSAQGDKRSTVPFTSSQLKLIGVQKTTVEKMNLTLQLPISGRVISSSSVTFQIYEKDLRYIRSGLIFRVESSTNSDESISGIITAIDSVVDPASRTIRVLGAIKKGPDQLRTETSFSGHIEIELKNRLAIPESSLLHTGNGDLIYLFDDDNRLTPKYVKVGAKSFGFYEVISGLSEGDAISSGPNFLIDSEAKIRGAND